MSLSDCSVRLTQSVTVLLSLIALMLAGCAASTGTMEVEQPLNVPLGKYHIVAVDVVSEGTDKNSALIADQLEGSVVANLREKKVFKKVYSRSATLAKNFDLIIIVTPVKVRDVDRCLGWTYIPGSYVGSSGINVKVTFIDGKTGEKLGAGDVIGKAAYKTTIFTSSSIAQAIEQAAEQIADYVTQNI